MELDRWSGVFGSRLGILLAALLLFCCSARAHQSIGGSVVVSPSSDPEAVAKLLAQVPAGARRVVLLRGFDFDIAKYDQILVDTRQVASPTASRSAPLASRSSFVVVRNPSVTTGSRVVQARVSGWMQRLRSRGAVVDQVLVASTDRAFAESLAKSTLPYSRAIAADSRIAASTPLGSLASPSGGTVDPAAWKRAIQGLLQERSLTAHRNAVRSVFPAATTVASGSSSSAGSTSVAVATPAAAGQVASAATAPPATPATPPTPPSPSNAALAVSQSRTPELTATIQTDARAALDSAAGTAPLAGFDGTLAYRPNEWSRVFEASQSTPALRQSLFALDACAQRVMQARPSMYTRPARLADIDPMQLDARYARCGPNAEAFALAMADCAQSDFIRSSGVELAVVAAYTNKPEYVDKCVDMLRATRDRVPLQRPGWTLYTPTAALPEAGDGVWLATAWGIEGIVEMLAVLGDRVPQSLRIELEQRLRSEVALIVRDWARSTPWYVRSNACQSNQWIEPSAGLVRACLFLRDPALIDAYNLGVRNLAASLERLGADGSFLEGVSYASMSSRSLLAVLGDLRSSGDTRCDQLGWTNSAWRWWMHMIMPGRQFVNCYDSRMSEIPAWAIENPIASMAQAALTSTDPQALTNVRAMFPGRVDASVQAVRYQAALAGVRTASITLEPYFHFGSQQVLCWRTAWEPPSATQGAMAIWMRGGSRRDSHAHRDQGHVSVYNGNRILLMECGTPDYATEGFDANYAGAAGHGTVQVGALEPRSFPVDVPISVARMDATGGEATVDLRPAFPGTSSCVREVRWSDSGAVTFIDRIVLQAPVEAGTPLLRFHTGAVAPLELVPTAAGTDLRWNGASLHVAGGGRTNVTEQDWPDAVRAPYVHRVAVVRAGVRASSFEITTELRFDRSIVDRDR
jgi:hypothetical protein